MAVKVAINGLGRIGISVLKIILDRDDIEVVVINATGAEESIEYNLKYDTIHKHNKKILVKDGYIFVDEVKIKILSEREPSKLNFIEYGAEIVLECTGAFLTTESVQTYIDNGIKNVILSAPAKDDTPMFVIGANEKKYRGEKIISNASCTTNALAPLVKILNNTFGISEGLMTTIHSYTSSQPILDCRNSKDLRKGRAGAINLIPTSTGAAKAISKVIPELEGKLNGQAIRVPTPNVSLIDLTVNLNKKVSLREIVELFENAKNNNYKGIIDIDNNFRVSQDFIGETTSSVIIKDKIQIIGDKMVKILSWYDNEWGYSYRLVDMAVFISSFNKKK